MLKGVRARLGRDRWASGSWLLLGLRRPAQWRGKRPGACWAALSPTLFLISFYLPKIANSKDINKRKKRLEKEFGH